MRCAGLALRITPNGVKSWAFRFRDRTTGRPGRATIGQYPAVGLTAARASADAMRRDVANGINPAARKQQDRATAGAKAFGALAERYLIEHARRHKRSYQGDERNLRKHVLPRWQNRPYASIKRGDVIELVEGLVTAGKPTLANRVHSLVSTVFTFALDAGLVEFNPCHRLRKRGVENVGRRVLSDAEIRLFWNGIVEPTRRVGLGLRLTLLTGARIGEIAGLGYGRVGTFGRRIARSLDHSGCADQKQKRPLSPALPACSRDGPRDFVPIWDETRRISIPHILSATHGLHAGR